MFKRGSAAALALTVSFAAAHLGSPLASAPSGLVPSGVHGFQKSSDSAGPKPEPKAGGCSAYEDFATANPHTNPEDENEGMATKLIGGFFSVAASKDVVLPPSVRYAVAIAPDPRHTNLSLLFDREMALIVQAAQDQHYDYNSSWLPWKAESPTLDHLGERQYADDLVEQRESCPGLILFRHRTESGAEAYRQGMVVFVVGEQATGGINQAQWTNALLWLNKHAGHEAGKSRSGDGILRILGPTFTGSLPSLQRNLKALYDPDPAQGNSSLPSGLRTSFPSARIISGGVSSCSAVRSFQAGLPRAKPSANGKLDWEINFGTFQENDSLHIYRFLNYLSMQGTHPSDTAILSEDETAYAAGDASDADCDFPYAQDNRPIQLVFPRDISALRNAYEKQEVFSGSSNGLKEHTHPILHDESPGDDSQEQITDTIPSSSGSIAAVDQEAYLYGLVSILRTHHSRYLMLRCTNPLDFLFLSRFFHRAYPEARIVTLGSDLLFRREIDTTEFRGVLALTSYPLLSRGQHWTRITEDKWDEQRHNHLVFQGSLAEGTYIAARYAFLDEFLRNPDPDAHQPSTVPLILPQPGQESDARRKDPLAMYRAFPIADYSDPFWFNADPAGKENFDTHPPTWISALGRDGYWPIAAIKDGQLTSTCLENESNDCSNAAASKRRAQPASTMVRVFEPDPALFGSDPALSMADAGKQHYEFKREKDKEPRSYNSRLLINVPLPWTLTALFALALVSYQVWGLWRGGLNPSDGFFSVFRLSSDSTQGILLGISSALSTMLLFEVAGVRFIPVEFSRVTGDAFGIDLLVAGVIASFILLLVMLIRRKSRLVAVTLDPAPQYLPMSVGMFVGAFLFFLFLYGETYLKRRDAVNDVPLFYRMIHLTDGVSPLLPILLLTFGFYMWNWQAMAGNLIVSRGCPILPDIQSPVQPAAVGWLREQIRALFGNTAPAAAPNATARLNERDTRISQALGREILLLAHPFCFAWRIVAAPIGLLIAATVCFVIPHNLPLLGLDGNWFNRVVDGILLAALLFTATEALRLYSTWLQLRKLLQALGRLRLRRTMARLRPIDSNSIWSVSGNVRRVQYELFNDQLDAANRMLLLSPYLSDAQYFPNFSSVPDYGGHFVHLIESSQGNGAAWDQKLAPPDPANPGGALPSRRIRNVLADAAGEIYNAILLPQWNNETASLTLEFVPTVPGHAEGKEKETDARQMPLSDNPKVRAAEEFVAFHYIAFIQNVVARMRTMTLSMIFLFITVCFAISFYPFVPRTEVGVWLMVNLALIGAAVAYVYAGMERDEILSYIANTSPGRLGTDFYVRLAGFLAGPVIGILTTQFPAITDTVVQWLQPGLDAIK